MTTSRSMITTIMTLIFWGALLLGLAVAEEPKRPDVNKALAPQQEAKILEVKNLELEYAFDRLKGIDFLTDNDLLNKAIFIAFKNRRMEVTAFCLEYLKKPKITEINGKWVNRGHDFYVAKKILQMFPDEASTILLDLYDSGDAVSRGNIIGVLGKMEGSEVIRNLLIEALDDKSFCEEEYPEMI